MLEISGTASPLQLVRLTINAYRLPRHLTMLRTYGKGVRPGREMVAGCGAAHAWIRIYTVDCLDGVVKRNPRAHFDLYVDDGPTSAAAGTKEEVVSIVGSAVADFKKSAKQELECDMADDKAMTVASFASLAASIRRHIGDTAGTVQDDIPNRGSSTGRGNGGEGAGPG